MERKEWKGEGWYDLLVRGRPVETCYYDNASALDAALTLVSVQCDVSRVHVSAARRIS